MTDSWSHLAEPLATRERTSRNVMTMAIKTSTPAAIERQTVPVVCATGVEGVARM